MKPDDRIEWLVESPTVGELLDDFREQQFELERLRSALVDLLDVTDEHKITDATGMSKERAREIYGLFEEITIKYGVNRGRHG